MGKQRHMTGHELFAAGVKAEDTDPEKAKELYTRAMASPDIEPMDKANSLLNLSVLDYNAGRIGKALEGYRVVVKMIPSHPCAWFNIGCALDDMGKPPYEVIQAYEKALAGNPDHADSHYNLAIIYERLKQESKALYHFRAYMRLDTNPKSPWRMHAQTRVRLYNKHSGFELVQGARRPVRHVNPPNPAGLYVVVNNRPVQKKSKTTPSGSPPEGAA